VLSPYLFALFIDSVSYKVQECGSRLSWTPVSILLYADDILLLSPSVSSLQHLVYVCQTELEALDMPINVRKSMCMRIGPRFNNSCAPLTTLGGHKLTWISEIRYLGIYLVSARSFSCLFSHAKKSFYRSFNAIFGKVGRVASEDVVVELFKTKCLPVLYYASEACHINKSNINAFEYVIGSCFRKILQTKSDEVVKESMCMFGVQAPELAIAIRKLKFLAKFVQSDNDICQLFIDNAMTELGILKNRIALLE
jgi:hypothetical protein